MASAQRDGAEIARSATFAPARPRRHRVGAPRSPAEFLPWR